MNTKTIYATQKNLKPVKPNLLYEKLDKHIGSNKLNFSNSGGLRKKNYYKSSIKDKPLISIITVSFNSEKTIEKTILSVLQQNYENIEYIVIDGNSKDGTLDIIKKYEGSIDLWVSENDEGIFNAINKGISNCSGDIIGILNSDDTLTNNALSLVKKYFENEVDFVFGSVEKDRLLSGFRKEKIKWKFNIYPGHSSGFFISKNAQLKVGLYDEQFKLHADYDLIYKLVCKLNLKGIAMERNDVTGKFSLLGESSKESFLKYSFEEWKIRKKNNQNLIFISILIILKIIYFYLFKLNLFRNFFRFFRKKISY